MGLIRNLRALAAQSTVARPRLWKISVKAGVAATPDSTPATFESTHCLSVNDEQNPDQLLQGMCSGGTTGCGFQNRHYQGNSLTFKFSCAGTLGMMGQGEVDFTETSLDGYLNVSIGEAKKIQVNNRFIWDHVRQKRLDLKHTRTGENS